MRHRLVIGALVAVVAIVGLAMLFWPKRMAEPPPPAAGPTIDEPVIEHPLPPPPVEAPAAPLPALADSDSFMTGALAELIGAQPAQDFIATPGIARRIVVTVDNLAREKVPVLTRAVGPIPGSLAVTREASGSSQRGNYRRRAPMQVVAQLVSRNSRSTSASIRCCSRPTVKSASRANTNDRVVAVRTTCSGPQLEGLAELEQPSVYSLQGSGARGALRRASCCCGWVRPTRSRGTVRCAARADRLRASVEQHTLALRAPVCLVARRERRDQPQSRPHRRPIHAARCHR